MYLTTGIDWKLENEADRWLYVDRVDVRVADGQQQGTVHGILSPEQLEARQRREVLTPNMGKVGEQHLMFRREYNPHLHRRRPEVDPYGELEYDHRVGTPVVSTAFSSDLWAYKRDPGLPIRPQDGPYHHLTKYQRSRCRKLLRQIPVSNRKARRVVAVYLAQQYGVPEWVITRCLTRSF